jgi:preprotein translocase subunit SecD
LVTTGTPAPAARSKDSIEFRAVLAQLPPSPSPSSTLAPADRVDASVKVALCDEAGVAQLPVVPTTKWTTAKPEECVVYPATKPDLDSSRYYLGPSRIASAQVRRARADFVSGQGWTVRLELTEAGSRAWDTLAGQQFHQQVAIVLQGKVAAAPIIEPSDAEFRSFDGIAVISGDYTRKQAQRVAALAAPKNR